MTTNDDANETPGGEVPEEGEHSTAGGTGDNSSSDGDAYNDVGSRDVDFRQLNVPPGDRNRVGALEAEIAQLKREADETRDKYLRSLAEFENYKKRALKERSELLKYQGKEMLQEFVEVVDDLERAVEAASGLSKNSEGAPQLGEDLRRGVELVLKRAVDTLSRFGVRGESGVGRPFDPQVQHALSRVPVADTEPGTVVNELKKTYFYKDIVLRHGQVVVAESTAQSAGQEPSVDSPSGNGEDPDNSELIQ